MRLTKLSAFFLSFFLLQLLLSCTKANTSTPSSLVKTVIHVDRSNTGVIADSSSTQYTYDVQNRCTATLFYVNNGGYINTDTSSYIYSQQYIIETLHTASNFGPFNPEVDTFYLNLAGILIDSSHKGYIYNGNYTLESKDIYTYDVNGYMVRDFSYLNDITAADTSEFNHTVVSGNIVKQTTYQYNNPSDTSKFTFSTVAVSSKAPMIDGNFSDNGLFGHSNLYYPQSVSTNASLFPTNVTTSIFSYTFDSNNRLVLTTLTGPTLTGTTKYTYY